MPERQIPPMPQKVTVPMFRKSLRPFTKKQWNLRSAQKMQAIRKQPKKSRLPKKRRFRKAYSLYKLTKRKAIPPASRKCRSRASRRLWKPQNMTCGKKALRKRKKTAHCRRKPLPQSSRKCRNRRRKNLYSQRKTKAKILMPCPKAKRRMRNTAGKMPKRTRSRKMNSADTSLTRRLSSLSCPQKE